MTISADLDHLGADSAPASLSGLAYDRLKDKLIMLDIRPGEPLNDTALGSELGVGRTPVREAIKRLETDHLVVTYPRRGTFATAVDVTELGSISDLRQTLEPLAARRAAENASTPVRAELRERADGIRRLVGSPTDQLSLIREDVAIHRAVYRAAGNRHLEEVLIRYDNLATRIWCLVIDRVPALADHIREHAALLEAIADGDAEAASRLASQHVTGFEEAIRRVL